MNYLLVGRRGKGNTGIGISFKARHPDLEILRSKFLPMSVLLSPESDDCPPYIGRILGAFVEEGAQAAHSIEVSSLCDHNPPAQPAGGHVDPMYLLMPHLVSS